MLQVLKTCVTLAWVENRHCTECDDDEWGLLKLYIM